MEKTSKSIYRVLIAVAFVLLFVPSNLRAIVYSVDGLIDVNRMAIDKLYYDLYYNPNTKIFSRPDAKELSPEAQAIIEKAIQTKISRAVHAYEAEEVDYSQITGENNCNVEEASGGSEEKFIGPFGGEIINQTEESKSYDPYIGNGTEVNPEIQTLKKPSCLVGGAKVADENMGYVYMVDMADKSLNAKVATVNSFRAKAYNNPVPRVFMAPSTPLALNSDEVVVHDNGQLVWENGQPIGVWVKNCDSTDKQRCFKVVKDTYLPNKTNFAYWADKANFVSGIDEVRNPEKIKVKETETTLNKNETGYVVSRNYSFLIDNYILTKDVLFCNVGWKDLSGFIVDVDGLPNVSMPYYGGMWKRELTENCLEVDSSGNCITRKYRITIEDACISGYSLDTIQPGSITTGTLSVVDQPVSVSITLPGHDTRLEPENVSQNTALIYAAAQSQLPGLIYIGNKKIKDIKKCSGTSQSYYSCH